LKYRVTLGELFIITSIQVNIELDKFLELSPARRVFEIIVE